MDKIVDSSSREFIIVSQSLSKEMTRPRAIKVIIFPSLMDNKFGSSSKKVIGFYVCYLNVLFPGVAK